MLVATRVPQICHAAEAALTNGSSSGAGAGPDTAVYTKIARRGGGVRDFNGGGVSHFGCTQETLLLSAINAAIVASVPQTTRCPPRLRRLRRFGSDASDHQQASLAVTWSLTGRTIRSRWDRAA